MSVFQLKGLEHEQFAPLFDLSDRELKARGILRHFAEENAGYPCRVSLQDAGIGDELLLLHYRHHAVDSPYRASGPIYVRRGQKRQVLAPDIIPDYVLRRIISVRAYNAKHMMIAAEVSEGSGVAHVLNKILADAAVAYVQLHNARQGCFSCQVDRAWCVAPTNCGRLVQAIIPEGQPLDTMPIPTPGKP